MQHLIQTTDLQTSSIESIFKKATFYSSTTPPKTLEGKTIITAFFENSTRTLSSFEIAAKNLGAKIIRLDISKSSTSKGETMVDTALNLNAMKPHAIIIRHKNAGAGEYLARYVNCPIINGGDGAHAHPTQALLDLFTISNHFKGDIKGKRVGIVGDIKNSRVANSNIELLLRFGLDITLIAPPHFLPITHLKTSHHLKESIPHLDIIIALRTQTERHNYQIYASLQDYAKQFCITKALLENHNIIILHPGPVHHNIDLDDEVLKDSRCKVLEQVSNGVFIRMAVMEHCILSN